MTSRTGIPLAVTLSAANVHDLKQLFPLIMLNFPRIGGLPGRPLELPLSVRADKGYDCGATRRLLRALGIEPHIPKRGQREENHLGHQRWQVERTLSWLKQYRRLRIRWDRQSEIHEAFLHLACSLIVWRQLNR